MKLTWKVFLKGKSLEIAFERGFGLMCQILTRKKNRAREAHLKRQKSRR